MPNNVSDELIEGVIVKELQVFPDERGRLMKMLQRDDGVFKQFGQLYMTTAYPGVFKGWHYHRVLVENFMVVKGTAKMVLYDNREGSATRGRVNEFTLGTDHPLLVQIPAGVTHGMKTVGAEEAIAIICSSEPYDPESPDKVWVNPDQTPVPYDWGE